MNDQPLLEHLEAIPLEGDAVVSRRPGLLAVFAGDPSDTAEVLSALHAEPRGGLDTIEFLRSVETVDIAAAVDTPRGVQLLLTGAMHALIDEGDPAEPGLEVRTPAGGSVTDLNTASAMVWIGTSQIRNVQRHPVFNLCEGTVPGGGILLRPIAEIGEGARNSAPPAPDERPAVVVPFDSVELTLAPPTPRPSLPIVGDPVRTSPSFVTAPSSPTSLEEAAETNLIQGIRCSREHFNNPRAAYCQVCGISMIHMTHRLVSGPRPTMGFIVFDDGATFALDRAYRLGRQPDPATDVDIIAITDSEHSLSRHHADLSFDQWDVVLTDRGSTNGTFLWNIDGARWERLQPDVPTLLPTGAHAALGRRTFTYESATRS